MSTSSEQEDGLPVEPEATPSTSTQPVALNFESLEMENKEEKNGLLNRGFNGVPKSDYQTVKKSVKTTTITYHGISYVVNVKVDKKKVDKHILNDLHGVMKPGANAILGPTGSGKTTLLDILAGRKDQKHLTGTVLINGNLQPDNFKCVSGYVVQDDVVMGTITVRENLYFSAALRLPNTVKKQQRIERVNEILNDLGLMAVADSKIGTEFIRGISGGERKRTSIGMELVTAPSVLFLDEPTTGLDASTAYSVMSLLYELGKRGKTIIYSIHQPRYSIFKLFDTMTLLSEGEIVYQGAASDALQYFDSIGYKCEEHNNPPDFFMDVINDNQKYKDACMIDSTDFHVASLAGNGTQHSKNDLAVAYKNSTFYSDVMKTTEPVLDGFKSTIPNTPDYEFEQVGYATSFFTQLYHVSGRAFKNLLRNPQTSIMQLVITVFFGLIVGAIYFDQKNDEAGLQNRVGAFFFIVMNQVFGNLSAVELFIKERKIFIHESAGGYYRASVYFLAKVICDLIPMRIIPITIFSAIVYFMIGLQNSVAKFFIFVLTLILTSLCGCGLSFFVSASVTTFANANLLVALPYVFMMVFSGVLVNLGSVGDWLSWVKYISIFKYSIESLEINELEDMVFTCAPTSNYTICPSGNDYLKRQDVKPSDLWFNELALAVMTIIYLLLAYIALRLIKKEK